MKRKVQLDQGAAVGTMLVFVILIGVVYWMLSSDYGEWWVFASLILTAVVALVGLFYCPLSLSAKEEKLSVNRSLWRKSIHYTDIAEIADFTPTKAAHSICTSMGFMGYWGWYSDPTIGKYFAYYGMTSQCFLIKLQSGKQYLLGCSNADTMKDFLRTKVQR